MKALVHCNPGDYRDEDGMLQDGTESAICNTLDDVCNAIWKYYNIKSVDHVHLEFRNDDNEEILEVTIPFKKDISPMTYIPQQY